MEDPDLLGPLIPAPVGKKDAPRTMHPRQTVVLTASNSLHLSPLLSRPQLALLTPLAATLMDFPASVANKRLTAGLSPLPATLTKNTGGGGLIVNQKSGKGFLSRGAQRRGISLALRRASLSRASRREVPLAPTVLCELKGHYSRSDDHFPGALVFSTDQGAPLSADNLRKKSLRTACRRAGLPRIDWHALRHTHGTLLHSQGTPLKVAQAQLGHSHMATTLDVYTHASASAQRDAVNLLEDQLFPNVPKFDGSGNTAQEEPQLLQ